jgi:hypothetical protein
VALITSSACSTAPPPQTAVMVERGDIDMPAAQLRLLVYGLAEEFQNRIENQADAIITGSASPEVVRHALLWKIETASNLELAAFSLDPLVSLYDIWVFAIQMSDFLETGPAAGRFENFQGDAIATVHGIEQRANDLFLGVITADDAGVTRGRVATYARAHPITGESLLRQTGSSEFAAELASNHASGLRAIGDMTQQMSDLTERVKYYAAGLPTRMRWELQLVLSDVLIELGFEEAFDEVEEISGAAFRIAAMVDTLPMMVDSQRQAISDAITVELEAGFGEIDRQRRETIDAITAERFAVLDAVTAERIAILDELKMITDSVVQAGPVIMTDTVDHLYDRVLRLILILLAGLAVLLLLYKLIPQRSRRSADS